MHRLSKISHLKFAFLESESKIQTEEIDDLGPRIKFLMVLNACSNST